MPKYATVCMNSGYIWWCGHAQDAIEACRNSDLDSNHTSRVFGEVRRDQNPSYAVYEVAADFDVYDGQNQGEIEAVQRFPLVGYFRGDDTE